jgi:hypothetical protein
MRAVAQRGDRVVGRERRVHRGAADLLHEAHEAHGDASVAKLQGEWRAQPQARVEQEDRTRGHDLVDGIACRRAALDDARAE